MPINWQEKGAVDRLLAAIIAANDKKVGQTHLFLASHAHA